MTDARDLSHRWRSMGSQCDFLAVRFSRSAIFFISELLATIWPLIEILRSLVAAQRCVNTVGLLTVALCPSSCAYVSYQNGSTDRADFWHRGVFRPILQGNLGILKNKGISLWNIFPQTRLSKFRHSSLVVANGVNFIRLRWTLSVMNWRPSSVELS